MTTMSNIPPGWSRRQIIKGGAALTAGAFAGLPIGKAWAQDDALHFWQFYAPDGGVKTQVDWFLKMADDWNAQSEVKVQLDCPSSDDLAQLRASTSGVLASSWG